MILSSNSFVDTVHHDVYNFASDFKDGAEYMINSVNSAVNTVKNTSDNAQIKYHSTVSWFKQHRKPMLAIIISGIILFMLAWVGTGSYGAGLFVLSLIPIVMIGYAVAVQEPKSVGHK